MKFFSLSTVLAVFSFSHTTFSQGTIVINALDTSGGVFAKVEKESSFPGGIDAWRNYLTENLKYPRKAQRKNIQGTVVVQFIVNKDGSLTDYEAINGPEELREAAIKVIKNSPNWIPAQQSGRIVKSYKKQPIAFRL